MAKVVGPLYSSEARGSIGALTYNSWRGIATVKSRCPKEPRDSEAQLATRELTRQCTIIWKTLTLAQATLWNNYSDTHLEPDWTGHPKHLTGYNWFIRINVRRLEFGSLIETVPPYGSITWEFSDLRVEAEDGYPYVWWTPQAGSPPASLQLEIYAGGPHSASRRLNIPECICTARPWFDYGVTGVSWSVNGWYTVFARILQKDGLVGSWQKSVGTFWPA